MKVWIECMRISRAWGRQDYEAAASLCHKVLVRDPAEGFAMSMLANCYAAQGRTREALDWAEKALAQMPESFALLQLSANLCAKREEHARAKGLIVRALATDPHRHNPPEWLLLFIRVLMRIPLVRRLFRSAAAAVEPGRAQRDFAHWKRWAEAYLAWLEKEGGRA